MDAVKFLKEFERMCKSFGECSCENCGIYKLRVKAGDKHSPRCDYIVRKFPEECVTIVEKWSVDHPKKTRAQDFYEKHPNAPKVEGYPVILPITMGYCGEYGHNEDFCYQCPKYRQNGKKCWEMPVE